MKNSFCMGLLYGRAGRLNTENGVFRPGQYNELVTAGGAMSEQRCGGPSFSLRLVEL
jgi:hypothetical protein